MCQKIFCFTNNISHVEDYCNKNIFDIYTDEIISFTSYGVKSRNDEIR